MSSFLIAHLPSHSKSLKAVEFMLKNQLFFCVSSNSSFLNLLTSSEGADGRFAAALGLPDEFKLGDEEKRLIRQFAAIEVKEEVDSDDEHHLKNNVDATEVKEEVESDVEQDDVRATEEGDSHGTLLSASQPHSSLVCRFTQIDPVVVPSTVTEQEVQAKSVLEEALLLEKEPNSLDEKEEDEQRMKGGEDRERTVDNLLDSVDAGDVMMPIDPIHDDHSLVFDASLDEDSPEQDTVHSANSTESVAKEEKDISESVVETPPVAIETDEPAEALTDAPMPLETMGQAEAEEVDDEDMEEVEEEDEEELVEEQDGEEDSTAGDDTKSDEEYDDAQEVIMKKMNGEPSGKLVGRLLFACLAKTCSSSYKTFQELEEHMEIHSEGQDFFCDVCKKSFSSKNDAIAHIQARMKRECCGCGKKTSLSYRLLLHLRSHTGEKPFVCQTCGKGFAQLGHLKSHILSHTGEKPYECNYCEYKGKNASHLKSHIRIHTGEKPYSCGYCEKRFTRQQDLKTHERTHTGEKPYECSHCGKKVTHRSALNSHIRIHTGQKPYSCEKCDKKFSRSDNLKDHMKRIHKS